MKCTITYGRIASVQYVQVEGGSRRTVISLAPDKLEIDGAEKVPETVMSHLLQRFDTIFALPYGEREAAVLAMPVIEVEVAQ